MLLSDYIFQFSFLEKKIIYQNSNYWSSSQKETVARAFLKALAQELLRKLKSLWPGKKKKA